MREPRRGLRLFLIALAVLLTPRWSSAPHDAMRLWAEAHAATCNPEDNLAEAARSFIGRCCQGRIRAVFPTELLPRTLGEIDKLRGSSSAAKSAWKLMSRKDYRK